MNEITSNILLILGLTPIIGILIILGLPSQQLREINRKDIDKEIALIVSLITFWISIMIWIKFDKGNPDFQMVQKLDWMSLNGTSFVLGIDSISLFFILLTTLLIPICILISWESVKHMTKEFVISLLLLESLLIIVFLVLDLISFYIFFESTLIPMVLIIAVWGSRKEKIQATYYLFIYTLIGSVFMLLGIFYIYYEIGTTDYQVLLNSSIPNNVQKWLWLAFFASFAVKIPMIPFHIWLPQAHTEAHLSGSIALAGILLKLGGRPFSFALRPTKFNPLIIQRRDYSSDSNLPPKMDNKFTGFATVHKFGKYRIGPHNQDVLGVIFGSLLGDGWLELNNSTVRFRNEKGNTESNRPYAFWLNTYFFELGYVLNEIPYIGHREKTDQVRYNISTVPFTSLKWIYDLFYPEGKKVVPLEIMNYLTPLGLAIWIMDDGGALNKGVKLSTHSFTLEECKYLIKVLNDRFQLKASYHFQGQGSQGNNQYIIYIWKESMPHLREIVGLYIIPEMRYKIEADLRPLAKI